MSSSPPDAPTAESLLAPETPYRGLTPYLEQDAPLFFGREDECDLVIDNMMASRLTVLYGASGVGKTSLLRAGVTHELLASSRRNIVNYGSPEFVVVYFNRWSEDPVAGLTHCVHESVATVMSGQAEKPAITSAGLAESLQGWTTSLGSDLLIILDQFEEYFLYHPDEDGDGSFAVEFPRAVDRADLRVSFLIAIREDALAKLDRFKGRIPNLFDNYLRTRHLDAAAARAAIEKPLEAYNRLVSADELFTAEPELVQMVLDQVQIGKVVLGAAGRGVVEKNADQDVTGQQIETPYLQLVLTRLWREEVAAGSHTLRAETLRRLGGAQQIVHTHLDEALRGLPARQQDVAAGIFHHLVTPSGTKIAHTAPDLADYAQLPQAEVESVLQELSRGDARILRPIPPPSGQPHAEPAYEIFHDVLAPAILGWWTRHAEARAAEAKLAARLKRSAEETRAAEERARYYRQLARLRRGIVIALVLLLALTSTVAVLALRGQQAALKREALARELVVATQQGTSRALASEAAVQARNKPNLAALLSVAAFRIADTVEARRSLLQQVELRSGLSGYLEGHTGGVTAVAFSPDGSVLASGGGDGKVRLWDPRRRALLRTLAGHTGTVRSVVFSPDGRMLASSSSRDRTTRVWRVSDGAQIAELRGPSEVRSVAFRDSRILATGGSDGALRLWDLGRVEQVAVLRGHTGRVESVVSAMNGRLASGSRDGTVRLWDADRRVQVKKLELQTPILGISVAFSPDGRLLSSGDDHGVVRLWDAQGSLIRTLRVPDWATSVAFAPDGHTLAVGSANKRVTLFDARSGRHVKTLNDHGNWVLSVAFSPDGRTFASGGNDDLLALRDLHRRAPSEKLTSLGGQVNAVTFRPDGRTALLAGPNGVIAWDLRRHRAVGALTRWPPATATAFSPDGGLKASGGEDGTVRVWPSSGQGPPRTFPGDHGAIYALAFSPDGRQLASGGEDGTVRVWPSSGQGPPRTFPGDHGAIYALAFSPDGRQLASGGHDGTVRVWPSSGQGPPRTFPGHRGEVLAVTFSPDGRLLAHGGEAKVVTLLDLQQPAQREIETRHTDWVSMIAFSPDGHTMAVGSVDTTVTLWDVGGGIQLGTLTGHRDVITALAYSPDGNTLVSGSLDAVVTDWDLSTESWRRRLCAIAGRELQQREWSQFVPGWEYRSICS